MKKDTKEGRIARSKKTDIKQALILVMKIILLILSTFKEEKVDHILRNKMSMLCT